MIHGAAAHGDEEVVVIGREAILDFFEGGEGEAEGGIGFALIGGDGEGDDFVRGVVGQVVEGLFRVIALAEDDDFSHGSGGGGFGVELVFGEALGECFRRIEH